MKKIVVFFGFLIISAVPSVGRADEQMTPLAVNGTWIALSHSESLTSAADVCIAAEMKTGFAIRADNTDIELRLVNNSWTLPADVTGSIGISVNGHQYSFDISANTANSVSATITEDKLTDMVGNMDKAATMSVTAGSAPAIEVTLIGSNPVIAAFLTCANIQAPTVGSSNNPFASGK